MSLAASSNNPFATPFTRPGAIPFRFPSVTSLKSFLAKLRNNKFQGQIVGPHGSGKSTLLATLIPAIERHGFCARSIALHNDQSRLPKHALRFTSSESPLMIVVDGYEQLSYISRAMLHWQCWRRSWGLLVTTHAKVAGLPALISLVPTRELMNELLDQWLAGEVSSELRQQAEISFFRHAGNLREVWFDLYDRHELKKREKASLSSAATA